MTWVQKLTIACLALTVVAHLGTIFFSNVSSWYSEQTTRIIGGAQMEPKPWHVRLFDRMPGV